MKEKWVRGLDEAGLEGRDSAWGGFGGKGVGVLGVTGDQKTP